MSDPSLISSGKPPDDSAQASERDRTVTIYDEDSGETFHVKAERTATVRHVVTGFYRDDLRRDRRPDDRLRCDANGSDVFAHESEDLEEYARQRCHELKWTFVGGTGGA